MKIGTELRLNAIKGLGLMLQPQSGFFDHVKKLVVEASATDLTGTEKHKMVMDDLKVVAVDVEQFVLNLLIELAYSYIKTLGVGI